MLRRGNSPAHTVPGDHACLHRTVIRSAGGSPVGVLEGHAVFRAVFGAEVFVLGEFVEADEFRAVERLAVDLAGALHADEAVGAGVLDRGFRAGFDGEFLGGVGRSPTLYRRGACPILCYRLVVQRCGDLRFLSLSLLFAVEHPLKQQSGEVCCAGVITGAATGKLSSFRCQRNKAVA